MEKEIELLSLIIEKTDNIYLLFFIVIAVIIIVIAVPLGLYYIDCKFNNKIK